MGSDFEKRWKDSGKGFPERLKETLRPETNLKGKLQRATRRIDGQGSKLKSRIDGLVEKDRKYYRKILEALRKNDQEKAAALANELAQIRQTRRILGQASLALEQITLRLDTVQSIGDIASTVAPAISTLRSIGKNIKGFFPQVDEELGQIQGELSTILSDAGGIGGLHIDFKAANEEAERILRQAEIQVEDEMKDRLPSVPKTEETNLRL